MTPSKWLDLFWVALGCLCVLANGYSLWDAWGDRQLVRAKGREPIFRIWATWTVSMNLALTTIQVLNVFIGLAAFAAPVPVNEDVKDAVTLAALILVFNEVLLAVVGVGGVITRRRMSRAAKQEKGQS